MTDRILAWEIAKLAAAQVGARRVIRAFQVTPGQVRLMALGAGAGGAGAVAGDLSARARERRDRPVTRGLARAGLLDTADARSQALQRRYGRAGVGAIAGTGLAVGLARRGRLNRAVQRYVAETGATLGRTQGDAAGKAFGRSVVRSARRSVRGDIRGRLRLRRMRKARKKRRPDRDPRFRPYRESPRPL